MWHWRLVWRGFKGEFGCGEVVWRVVSVLGFGCDRNTFLVGCGSFFDLLLLCFI